MVFVNTHSPEKPLHTQKVIHNCFLGFVLFWLKRTGYVLVLKAFNVPYLTNYKMETCYVLLEFRAKSECLSIFQKWYWWIPTTFKLCKCFIRWRTVCMYIHACIVVHICTHYCMHVAVFTWRWKAPGLNNSHVLQLLRAHVYREMNEMHFKKCSCSLNFIKCLFKEWLFILLLVWSWMSWIQIKLCAFDLRRKVKKANTKKKKKIKKRKPNQPGLRIKLKN